MGRDMMLLEKVNVPFPPPPSSQWPDCQNRIRPLSSNHSVANPSTMPVESFVRDEEPLEDSPLSDNIALFSAFLGAFNTRTQTHVVFGNTLN